MKSHGVLCLFAVHLGDLIEEASLLQLLHGFFPGQSQKPRHLHQLDLRAGGDIQHHGLSGRKGCLSDRIGADDRSGRLVAALLLDDNLEIQRQISEDHFGIGLGIVDHVRHGIRGRSGGDGQGNHRAALDHAIGRGVLANDPALLHGIVIDPVPKSNLEIGIGAHVYFVGKHAHKAGNGHLFRGSKELRKKEGIEENADGRQGQRDDDKACNQSGGIVLLFHRLLGRAAADALSLSADGPFGGRARLAAAVTGDHRRRGIVKAEGNVGVLAKFIQVLQHLGGALIALVHISRHGVHGDLLQALGNLGIQDPGRNGLGIDMLNGHRHRRLAVVGRMPCEHLIHDDAQGIEIGPEIDPAALGLLRGNIVHRAQGFPGQGTLGRGHTGNAKVGHLYAAVLEDHDIVGLDVPVDDPAAVGMLQRLGDLRGKMQRLPPVENPLLLHILLERNAVNQLHHDVVQIVGVRHVIDIDDIGMREHGDGLGLGMEPAAELGVLRQLILEDLDGHQPVQTMAPGLIDHGHAAGADDLENLIPMVQKPPYVILHT